VPAVLAVQPTPVKGDGVDELYQHVCYEAIDFSSRDPLTDGLGIFDTFSLTDIVRYQAAATPVIADRHAPAAAPANDQTLQESSTFSSRTLVSLAALGMSIFP
jgi:hypothetical protein